MNVLKVCLIAMTLSATAGLAEAPKDAAKGERAHKMHERLKAADKNGDGKISREEANASLPKLARHFDEIDTNKDGQITREEMRAFREKRHAEKSK